MATNRSPVLMHLDPEKLDALNRLAQSKGIHRSVFLREAIDDLLVKHRVRVPSKPRRRKS
jgi:hypothetical protein